jgi:hypothetical protein
MRVNIEQHRFSIQTKPNYLNPYKQSAFKPNNRLLVFKATMLLDNQTI